ncbi:MAG: MBL fold metallo-hydrolase [Pyrinomonadaceae bacterium]|nr:MBL fold metallo-hydrolase [Pyrinomonadaceae bacterium]
MRNKLLLFWQISAFIVLAVSILSAQSVTSKERKTTKVTEGVYVITHRDAPDTFPQGNTIVIIGDKDVLVVDSCLLPSSAKEDIAQIKQWTDKPVKYLVNTHWHFDHNNGNGTYAAAFPNLTIIAHAETQRMIENYNPMAISNYPTRRERFKKMLESGKDNDGVPLSDALRKDLEVSLVGLDEVVAEFQNIKLTPINISFTEDLNLNLGNREVQIKFLGRGNTAGDTIVYLPKEKIASVGDLMVHPVPYFFGGFPLELPATLQKVGLLNLQSIIPGHGEILHNNNYLNQIIALVTEVNSFIKKETTGNPNLKIEDAAKIARQKIDVPAWRKKFAGDNQENGDYFEETFDGLIKSAFKQAVIR